MCDCNLLHDYRMTIVYDYSHDFLCEHRCKKNMTIIFTRHFKVNCDIKILHD